MLDEGADLREEDVGSLGKDPGIREEDGDVPKDDSNGASARAEEDVGLGADVVEEKPKEASA